VPLTVTKSAVPGTGAASAALLYLPQGLLLIPAYIFAAYSCVWFTQKTGEIKGERPVLREMLAGHAAALMPGRTLHFHLLDKPPVAGAIVWALRLLHGGGEYLDLVCGQM